MTDFFKEYLCDQIEKNEIGGACCTYGREEVLVGKTEGNRPLGRPRCRLRWIFNKWDVGAWNGSNWLGIGTCDGHL